MTGFFQVLSEEIEKKEVIMTVLVAILEKAVYLMEVCLREMND